MNTVRRALVAVVAAATLTGCDPTLYADPASPLILDTRSALAELDDIPDLDREALGYRREEFGDWTDTDGDGCDTREEILVRDADTVETVGCQVTRITLTDPYTGDLIGDRADIDIDHVVPLAVAWRAGADRWPRGARVEFANDPINLLAVDDRQNRIKSDSTPHEWLPPNPGQRCAYAATYVTVLRDYGLGATPPTKAVLRSVLTACPVGTTP